MFPDFYTTIPTNCLIYQHNCRSLSNKIFEYRQLTKRHRPPLLCLSETHHTTTHTPRLSGYVTYAERGQGHLHVITFVRRDLTQKARPLISRVPGLHVVAVDINIANTNLTIINLYASPTANITGSDFENLLEQLPTDNTILTGDFNAHNIAWGARITNARGAYLLEAIQHTSLIQANTNIPTYIRLNPPAFSCLDLTFASSVLISNIDWKVYYENHGSDHQPTLICFRPIRRQQITYKLTDWRKYNHTLSNLQQLPTNIYDLERTITTTFTQAQVTCKEPEGSQPPDMTLFRLQAERRRAQRRYSRSRNCYERMQAASSLRTLQKHRKKLAEKRWVNTCAKIGDSLPDWEWY